MDEKARQARAAYYRERYANMTEEQKEKHRESVRNYRKRNREKVIAYYRKWHKEHPGKNKEYCERYWTRKAERAELAAGAADVNPAADVTERTEEGTSKD